jgi:hypothetical protein
VYHRTLELPLLRAGVILFLAKTLAMIHLLFVVELPHVYQEMKELQRLLSI